MNSVTLNTLINTLVVNSIATLLSNTWLWFSDTTANVDEIGLGHGRSKRSIDYQLATNDIQFKIADILSIQVVGDKIVQLQAYKIRSNSDEWVSIGYPSVVPNFDGSPYELTPESILLRLRLLPDDQIQMLRNEAKKRYPNVSNPTIHLIPLQSVFCSTIFAFDDQIFELKGDAHSFNEMEITIEISCAEYTVTRAAFLSRLSKFGGDLKWKCSFMAAGHELLTNHIKISGRVLQEVALEGELFGDGDSAYVTRNQLNLLTQKISTKFSIVENCELDEKLDEEILHKLISMATLAFREVAFNDVLDQISRFGVSSAQQELSPNEINRQLNDIFTLKKFGNKSYIETKNETRREGLREHERSKKFETKIGWGWFSVSFTYDKINKRKEMWKNRNFSLQKQLDDLNFENQDGVMWEVQGSKIVPKSLTVALMNKGVLSNDISLSHRRSTIKNAQFMKEMIISTVPFLPAVTKSDIANVAADAISKATCKKNFMSAPPIMNCVSKHADGRTRWTMDMVSTDGKHSTASFGCSSPASDQFVQQVEFSPSNAVENQGPPHNDTCCNYQFFYDEALASF